MPFKMPSDEQVKSRIDKMQKREARIARQKRLDMFACAALTGIGAGYLQFTLVEASKTAYDMAEAMEAERERRIKEQVK